MLKTAPRIDIYLFGEEHNNTGYQLAAYGAVKRFAKAGKINCLSLEMEVEKYQASLDDYDWKSRGMVFGRYTPLISLAKEKGLEVIASDYRDTLATFIINEIDRIDREGKINLEDQKNLDRLLRPLILKGKFGSDNFYKRFLDIKNIDDLSDFFLLVSQEERERHMSHQIIRYLRKNSGSAIFHLSGRDHIDSLKKKLSKAGYEVATCDQSKGI